MHAFIFDMDGLMLDTQSIAHQALKMTSKDFGLAITDEMCNSVRGLNESNTFSYLENSWEVRISESDYFSKFHNYYEKLLDENIPIKVGLVELLDTLDFHKIPKAIATSTNYDLAIKKLKRTNLKSRFPIVVGGDQVKQGKPFPDIFLKAAQLLLVEPNTCIVLEDSDAGIRAAFDAGMQPIMVPDGNIPSTESKEFAVRIFKSLDGVTEYVKNLIY